MPTDIKNACLEIANHVIEYGYAGAQHKPDFNPVICVIDLLKRRRTQPEHHLVTSHVCLGTWGLAGYQQVTLGYKQAAALAAAKITEEVASSVKLPWPSLWIEFPHDMFKESNGSPIHGLLLTEIPVKRKEEDPPSYELLFVTADNFVHAPASTLEQMAAGLKKVLGEEGEDLPPGATRTTNVLMRIAVNLCLALTNREEFIDRSPRASSKTKRKGALPQVHNYVWNKTIEHDCRPLLKNYLEGTTKRSELAVQFMVCGHFRRQPFGPGNLDRKVIWVDAFWKGQVDAPILVTPKALKNVTPDPEL